MKKPVGKLCATCLSFYCCNLSQITKDCPVKKPVGLLDRPVVFTHPKPLYSMENHEKPFVGDSDHDEHNDRGHDHHDEGRGRE